MLDAFLNAPNQQTTTCMCKCKKMVSFSPVITPNIYSLLLLCLLFPLQSMLSQAAVECADDDHCATTLRNGSVCVRGFCTNPFHSGGCLKNYIPDWKKTRICNSDDPPSAVESGHCVMSPLDYTEIRVNSNNWEVSFFQAWILQIILSEMLDVPVSIETGLIGYNVDLYDISSRMDYGVSQNWESLRRGTEVGDCRKLKTEAESEYKACSHVDPDLWPHGYSDLIREAINLGHIEHPVSNGGGGEQFWYIPRFTAERDPSLVSYIGLAGESNRRKVATTFKFPTTWKEYCQEVSQNNCTTDDGVAVRAPVDEEEERSFFKEGLYTGNFRLTDKNDCDKYPKSCTGFIADYPCDWWSAVPQQAYHLNIALEGGFTNLQAQIWAAANATKSDVIMMWFSPEVLVQEYLGTDAEFIKVLLPTPTQSCIENRITNIERCSLNMKIKVGNPEGSCDYRVQNLQKAISHGLYEITHDPDTPEELWSPAYDLIKNLHITNMHIGDIMEYWITRGTDRYGFDARDAACRWVVENIDVVESFVPQTHPRVVQEFDVTGHPLFTTAEVAAVIAVLVVLTASLAVYFRRNKKAIHYAQFEILLLILFGLLLIAVGALVLAVPPSDFTCITSIWLTGLGYVLEVMPLTIRIYVINKFVNLGKHMKRVRLRRRRLLVEVFALSSGIYVFLLVWTIVDPPKLVVDYELTQVVTDMRERVVVASSYCDSQWDFWARINVAWQSLILVVATVLTFLAKRVKEDMNGVRSLSILIYTQLLFVIVRVSILSTYNTVDLNGAYWMAIQTLVYSAEVILAVLIFILPKLLDNKVEDQSEQLPDLFLNTTIMYADISGFTPWCSLREPVQVFRFLDELYEEFDLIASRKGVFKVETVGDCYVAATGLPEPSENHAVQMAKFAIGIMQKMNKLTKKLEVLYGPDTTDLELRIGVHSGPVTGGFLKGNGTRFQLFGETMNTTERIEASGQGGRVHMSESTANLLLYAGKQKWVRKREDKVQIKGKGELQTYWLERPGFGGGDLECSSFMSDEFVEKSSRFTSSLDREDGQHPLQEEDIEFSPERTQRLIDWNVQVLSNLLLQIVSRRNTAIVNKSPNNVIDDESKAYKIPLEEVKEIVEISEFDATAVRRAQGNDKIDLRPCVEKQLREYVATVAGMYRENYFHNFEHASHVVMAVTKHMSRIVAPSDVDLGIDEARLRSKTAATLHDHTYGITSDPLAQLGCVFSALIHDVDHPGVPNPQLIKENEHLATKYQERSVAEQNSFDLAWTLLMKERFNDLRATICCNKSELARFRQLVVNSIMATDLGDKELKALRNARWDKAFSDPTQQPLPRTSVSSQTSLVDLTTTSTAEGSSSNISFTQSNRDSYRRNNINRKATIVIEHLIQASDVAHTMQHWHVYRKWNEKLFRECYEAYRNGRRETNPADGWYEGELGFFDFYIIPLAKKLDSCGVFGVSSDENLSYAVSNRAEWEKKGRQIVAEMLEEVQS